MNICTVWTGKPCKCIRLVGSCTGCGNEVAVTHGERAPAIPHEKGRLIGYLCPRCRR